MPIGDVAGPFQFTHTAAHQAWYAAVNGLFGSFWKFKADYTVVPWATFIDPEVARVGLNEQEAKAQGIAHEITRFDISGLDRAIAEQETAWQLISAVDTDQSSELIPARLGIYYAEKAKLAPEAQRRVWREKSIAVLVEARKPAA